MTQEQEWSEINYGDVLSIFGIPHNDPDLLKYGSKVFDKRTRLYKEVTKRRREELALEYTRKYIPF